MTKSEWWQSLDQHWQDIQNIVWKFVPNPHNLQELKDQQNPDIVRLLFAAWDNAPDNRSIHSIPSWHVLCDLLAEEYSLYE